MKPPGLTHFTCSCLDEHTVQGDRSRDTVPQSCVDLQEGGEGEGMAVTVRASFV